MLLVPSHEYDHTGIGNLEEAVSAAREHGIANAVGAISPGLLGEFQSVATIVQQGNVTDIPGVYEAAQGNGVGVYSVQADQTPSFMTDFLGKVQTRTTAAAGDDLPGWNPVASKSGIRMVTMVDSASFQLHSDDYEGLVAAVQVAVDGKKTMFIQTSEGLRSVPVGQGDITLFAGDTFSQHSRRRHGFVFSGSYAVALTLGQDPHYTISGNYPHPSMST